MIFSDGGPFVSYFVSGDPNHRSVRDFFANNRQQISIASPVLAEVSHFLNRHRLIGAEVRFLRLLADGIFPVVDPILADYARAADFVEEYANFPLGTVDALIAAMAERLKVTTLLTLDRRHFEAIRPSHCERFELVP